MRPWHRERRNDGQTRDRIGWLQLAWERTARGLWRAMVILYVAAFIGGFFLWRAFAGIQDSRYQAAYRPCQETNLRHDRTVAAFRLEFAAQQKRNPPQTEKDRRNRQASLQANIRLINVFVPVHKDRRGRSTCRQFAKELVNTDGTNIGP